MTLVNLAALDHELKVYDPSTGQLVGLINYPLSPTPSDRYWHGFASKKSDAEELLYVFGGCKQLLSSALHAMSAEPSVTQWLTRSRKISKQRTVGPQCKFNCLALLHGPRGS